MKVAIATDDKETISNHFGKAKGFMIFEIQKGKVIDKIFRENIGKNTGECGSCNHSAMINNLKDCTIVISYGMGQKIYNDLLDNKITPIVTEERTIEKALDQFLSNHLKNHLEKLH